MSTSRNAGARVSTSRNAAGASALSVTRRRARNGPSLFCFVVVTMVVYESTRRGAVDSQIRPLRTFSSPRVILRGWARSRGLGGGRFSGARGHVQINHRASTDGARCTACQSSLKRGFWTAKIDGRARHYCLTSLPHRFLRAPRALGNLHPVTAYSLWLLNVALAARGVTAAR